MVIAQHLSAVPAHGAMRIDEHLRVDFEMSLGAGMNIGSRNDSGDPCDPLDLRAQQYSARLARMRCASLAYHDIEHIACHFNIHRAWTVTMEDGEVISGTLESAVRLDKALAQASGLSRARVQALIAEGRVELEGAVALSPAAKIAGASGFTIHLPPPAQPFAQPQEIALDIVYEDAHVIVVNKRAGMVVHPAAGNRDGTLVNALLHHCKDQLSGIGGVARPGIVHRIDKDTSGLLVAAKSDAAHEGLARQFADHSIERRYLAVCAGHPRPPQGTITARIGRSDKDRKKMAVLSEKARRGKHAVTHYQMLTKLDGAALIECRLETGRTHQVRVHCASIGHALLGDLTYGRTPKQLRSTLETLGFARQALHAADLGFIHPVSGEKVSLSAPLPDDMRRLIDETAYKDR